ARATLDVVAPSEPVRRPATSVDEYAASLHRVRARPLFRRLIPVGRTARSEVESLVGTADVVHVHMPSPRLEAWAAMACVRGRLVPYKGLHVMVEAAKSFSGKSVTFAVGGKGPLRSPLESEVDRLGLREMFRFLGFIPDGSVGDLLRASDVVVCPSISLAES